MRQVFKKAKPTEATYFQSESQRKRTSRLSFIYGSKQLVAVLSILVVGSAISGIAIVQKQRDSSAATQKISISSNEFAKWNYTNNGDNRIRQSNEGSLSIIIPASSQLPNTPSGQAPFNTNAEGCWNITLPDDSNPVTNANFNLSTDAAGTTAVVIKRNNTETVRYNSQPPNPVNVTFEPAIGGTISVCHVALETRKFNQERKVAILGYSIFTTQTEQLPALSYSPGASIAPPSTMTNGQAAGVIITVKNEGTNIWYNDDTGNQYPVRLATVENTPSGDKQMTSLFRNEGDGFWLSTTRIKMQEREVPPGGTATFQFTMVARSTDAGKPYKQLQYFNLVHENQAWFPPKGLAFKMDVEPKLENIQKPLDENTPSPVSENNNSTNPRDPTCKIDSPSLGPNLPLPASQGRLMNGASIVSDEGREVVRLDAAGKNPEYVDCVVSLPTTSQAGGYVLAFSGKSTSPNTSVEFVMQSGSDNIQSETKEFSSLAYDTPVDTTSRMKIIRSGSEKTVRFIQPGEEVLVRATLRSGSFNLENFQFFRDPCTSTSGDIIEPGQDGTCDLAIEANKITNPEPNNSQDGEERRDASSNPTDTPPAQNCEVVGFTEAENGTRKGLTSITQDPLFPNINAVVLFTNSSSVECVVKSPKSGKFTAAAKIRSQDYDGIAKAKIEMTTDSTTSSRELTAAKDQKYSTLRFNQPKDYLDLREGENVTIKINLVNDSNDRNQGDRNLWVDSLLLVEIPPEQSAENDNTTKEKNTNESEIVPCDTTSFSEAEEASRFNGASVHTDKSAPGGNSIVKLQDKNQYIECALSVSEAGKYILGATAKSYKRPFQDEAQVKLEILTGDRIQQTDTQTVSGKYDRIRMRVNGSTATQLDAGDKVTVRISAPNSNSSTTAKKHLLIDSFELIKIPEKNDPKKTPLNIKSDQETIPITNAEDNSEEIKYNSASGAVNIKVEAENATFKGTRVDETADNNASGNSAVKLWSNKNFVEYNVYFPETDFYSLDFAGRSENHKGTAKARLYLNNKKIRDGVINLKTDTAHNYYTSKDKVQVNKGTYVFRVEFINDERDKDGDRNLIIDYLRVRGTKRIHPVSTPSTPLTNEKIMSGQQYIEAENGTSCKASRKTANCSSLAISDEAAYGGRALELSQKGDHAETKFTINRPGTYSVGATLRSVDYKGSAKANIYIDGKKVANSVVPRSDSFNSPPSFMYERNFKANSVHTIKVVYINDLCDTPCSQNTDRNLLVDRFQIFDIDTRESSVNKNTKTANSNDTYGFVSMPDFINADIGDVSQSPNYKPQSNSMFNSTSPEWESSLDTILNAVKNEGHNDVLIAGDFVEGEWGIDTENTGIFGGTNTESEKRRAVEAAGSIYYKQGAERFASRGLNILPAIGDHEIGDNPWNINRGPYAAFKHRNVDVFKETYSKYYMKNQNGVHRFNDRPNGQANNTAYATRPHPNVQIIALDVFRKNNQDISVSLDGEQLDWLDGVLSRANRDNVEWIIVQGHAPIIKPADGRDVPRKNSSGLSYEGGSESDLWKMMVKHKVDLYLAGEVHRVSAIRQNGIVQLAHGGLTMSGDANYITARIDGKRMTIQSKYFGGAYVTGKKENGLKDFSSKLWNPNMEQYSPYKQVIYPNPIPLVGGNMQLESNNSKPTNLSGELKLL